MRSLVVAEQYPWPPVDGYRQRLGAMIGGLAAAGRVDVVALDRPPEGYEHDHEPPELAGLGSVVAAPAGPGALPRDWLRDWLRPGGPPRRILSPDWSAARRAVAGLLAESQDPDGSPGAVDLVWCSHVDAWWPLRDLLTEVRCIVDFDNLEHLAMRLRRRTPVAVAPGSDLATRARATARWAASRAVDVVDERRWERVQRECAAHVEAVVVCSELDRVRSGCANAVVIGNGADPPARVLADRTSLQGPRPVVSFVGALNYEPNADAVRFFVEDVWPTVHARHPRATFRVVGRGGDAIAWVDDVDGVELVGPVDDLTPELEATDVSVVPIRIGAGTRLKVVEALANRLPLVTTSVGCEGIDVRDGVDALVVDDATSFAHAVGRLLDDGALRQRLADSGASLFERRYEWSGIRERVTSLATGAAAPPSGGVS